jgi:phytoene synthase
MSADGPHEEGGLPAASVREAARGGAYDRYLAALLAPVDAQADLVVLAAFLGEVSRIPLVVRDATIGEIRFQWWRDALEGPSVASGHPVADAVSEMTARRGLPKEVLLAIVDGFARELYEDGIEDEAELSLYADETQGSVLRLALAILGCRQLPADPLANAARAASLTHLALTLPQHLAHGRLPLPPGYGGGAHDPRSLGPADARDAARVLTEALAADASRALVAFRAGVARGDGAEKGLAVFLPLALVERYLAAATKPGRDVLTDVADISPLSRVTRLWFAYWRGRV